MSFLCRWRYQVTWSTPLSKGHAAWCIHISNAWLRRVFDIYINIKTCHLLQIIHYCWANSIYWFLGGWQYSLVFIKTRPAIYTCPTRQDGLIKVMEIYTAPNMGGEGYWLMWSRLRQWEGTLGALGWLQGLMVVVGVRSRRLRLAWYEHRWPMEV